MLYGYGMTVPPEVIYIIRHAEKPLKPPASGVNFEGSQNEHSLLPRGWQRSGALAALFHPDFGPLRAGLRTPTVLVAPSWGHPGKTAAHRSYQTNQGLSEQLGLPIESEFAQGQEQQLVGSLVRSCPGGRAHLLGAHPHPGDRLQVAGRQPNRHPAHVAGRPVRRHLVVHPRPGARSGPLHLRSDSAAAASRRCRDSDPGGRDEPEHDAGQHEHHKG